MDLNNVMGGEADPHQYEKVGGMVEWCVVMHGCKGLGQPKPILHWLSKFVHVIILNYAVL